MQDVVLERVLAEDEKELLNADLEQRRLHEAA